jgi:hypothetical protein
MNDVKHTQTVLVGGQIWRIPTLSFLLQQKKRRQKLASVVFESYTCPSFKFRVRNAYKCKNEYYLKYAQTLTVFN